MARMTSGRASNLRDCPISKPGDDIWSPTPENCQASYRVLDRELKFPDDVPLYLDQVARQWSVNSEALLLQALLTINEKLDRLCQS